jgi:hypothetical protein
VVGVQPPEPNVQYLEKAPVPIADGTYRIRAVLRLRCELQNRGCTVGKVAVAPGSAIHLPLGRGTSVFVVDEVHPVSTRTLEVTFRTLIPAEMLPQLQDIQVDHLERFPARDALQPSFLSLQPITTESPIGMRTILVRLHVPAVRTTDAWVYRGEPLRIGREFAFEAGLYSFRGPIVQIRETANSSETR